MEPFYLYYHIHLSTFSYCSVFDFCSCRSGHNGEEFDLANNALESVEEPDEKQTMMDASTVDVNTYSKAKNCV